MPLFAVTILPVLPPAVDGLAVSGIILSLPTWQPSASSLSLCNSKRRIVAHRQVNCTPIVRWKSDKRQRWMDHSSSFISLTLATDIILCVPIAKILLTNVEIEPSCACSYRHRGGGAVLETLGVGADKMAAAMVMPSNGKYLGRSRKLWDDILVERGPPWGTYNFWPVEQTGYAS